jgi:hypothetical protein
MMNVYHYVGTLKTRYLRIQALRQDEEQDGRSCVPTCPIAPALASWLRATPEPPRVPWLQLPPPGSGPLQSRMCPMELYGLLAIEVNKYPLVV